MQFPLLPGLSTLLPLSIFFLTSHALPRPPLRRDGADKPPAFFLAGDSTTAKQSSNGGGWGDGFLNTTLTNGATGINFGHNGATTVSFRAGGDWTNVLNAVTSHTSTSTPYVTIQFGHNDQKPTANISIAQFTSNLERFVTDVRTAGGNPIIVTSLSRRNYNTATDPPTIIENLADVTAAAIQAANAVGAPYIDLNKASTAYLNAIGPQDAYTYNLNPTDYTHLNGNGSVVFGGLVAELIGEAVPELKDYLVVDPALLEALQEGTYYFPGAVAR